MNIRVRQASRDDKDAIVAFIDESYGQTAPYKRGSRWKWQLIDNPARNGKGDAVPIWIAQDEATGRIVGQIAVQEGYIRAAGERFCAGWIVDVMVLPEVRGQGLGHRIHEAVAGSMTTLVTLTMAPATRRIAQKHGCVTLGPTYQLNRVLRASATGVRTYLAVRTQHHARVRSIARFACRWCLADWLLAMAVNLTWWIRDRLHRKTGSLLDVNSVEALEERDRAFLESVMSSREPIFERSGDFYDWRFFAVPDLRYRVFRAEDGGRVRGLLVLRMCQKDEFPSGVIVDLLTTKDDAQAIDCLIAFAVEHFRGSAEAVDAAASTPDLIAGFRRAGFVRTRTMRPTVVCSDARVSDALGGPDAEWFFSKADHDWDQVHPVSELVWE